jgi:hypothetical protein
MLLLCGEFLLSNAVACASKLIFHDGRQACVSQTACNFLIDLWKCPFDGLEDERQHVKAPHLFCNVVEEDAVAGPAGSASSQFT